MTVFVLLHKKTLLQILFCKCHSCKLWKDSKYFNVLNFHVWCILGNIIAFICLIVCPYLFYLSHNLKALLEDYLVRVFPNGFRLTTLAQAFLLTLQNHFLLRSFNHCLSVIPPVCIYLYEKSAELTFLNHISFLKSFFKIHLKKWCYLNPFTFSVPKNVYPGIIVIFSKKEINVYFNSILLVTPSNLVFWRNKCIYI